MVTAGFVLFPGIEIEVEPLDNSAAQSSYENEDINVHQLDNSTTQLSETDREINVHPPAEPSNIGKTDRELQREFPTIKRLVQCDVKLTYLLFSTIV